MSRNQTTKPPCAVCGHESRAQHPRGEDNIHRCHICYQYHHKHGWDRPLELITRAQQRHTAKTLVSVA